jgi:hypothetical protein
MYFSFGKGKGKGKKSDASAPEIAGSLPSAFGRYLRYGRRSAFGRRYFGSSARYPQFGNKSMMMGDDKSMMMGGNCFGKNDMMMNFGRRHRRRRGARKGGRKSRKPSKALMRMCRKHGIKCTKKVGKRRVYKSVSVLKKQLRRKKSLRRRKVRKVRKVRAHRKRTRSTRRVRRRRRTMFGKRRKVSLFGFRI